MPEEIGETLQDIIRDKAAERCPAGFPRVEWENLTVAVVLDPEVSAALIEAHGASLLSEHERETVAKIISEMIDAENPRLRAQCYDLAFRLNLRVGGMTQDQIAQEHGIGKAAVSKECRRIVREFSLPPARGMKSREAVEVYRERQVEKHEKRRIDHRPWKFGGDFAEAFSKFSRN